MKRASWHQLFEHVSDVVLLLDRDLTIRFCNDAGRRYFQGEVIGQPVDEIMTFDRELVSAAELGQGPLEVKVDGDVTGRVAEAGKWLCVALDPRGSGEPRQAATKLLRIDLDQGTWHLHPDIMELLGVATESVATEELLARMHEDDSAVCQLQLRAIRRGERDEFDLKCQLNDRTNNYRWFQLKGVPSTTSPGRDRLWVTGTIEDVNESYMREQEQALIRNRIQRFQKMESMSQLVGGIAHDFNNILGSILGHTELALMEVDPTSSGRLATYLKEVHQSSRRARDLVRKMLMFSLSEESVETRPLDIGEELETTVRILRATLPSSIEIKTSFEPDTPAVDMDGSQLQQIIMNLALNSREAMEDVGTIYLRSRYYTLGTEVCSSCHGTFSGSFVELTVEDTGTGIESDIVYRIFEPYVTTKPKASGLGLSVVHGLVHNQGGHVLLDSLAGDGTEVRFFFEPHAHEADSSLAQGDLASDLAERVQHAYRLLIIDDEVALATFMHTLLETKGYTVEVATGSRQALEMFLESPFDYDLVITDQAMPELSGLDLAKQMLDVRPDLPIILCTGYSQLVGEHNYHSFGIQGFLTKPLDSRTLLQKIETLLEARA